MTRQLISIIVPIYNAERYLEECLESLLVQDYNNFEVLLINDGSTDRSEEICQKYCRAYDFFKYFFKVNTGVSDTRNFGMRQASGDYLCFIDSDDILSKTYLSDFSSVFVRESYDKLICCDYIKFNQLTEITKYKFGKKFSYELISENIYDILFNRYKGYLWNKIFSNKIIEDFHLEFDTSLSMCEDMVFVFNYLHHVKSVILLENKNYYYRINQASSGKSKSNQRWFTVLDACSIIAKELNKFNNKQLQEFSYFYNYMVCKSKYRLLFVDQNKENITEKIQNARLLAKEFQRYLSCKQKIKIKLYDMLYYPYFSIKKD